MSAPLAGKRHRTDCTTVMTLPRLSKPFLWSVDTSFLRGQAREMLWKFRVPLQIDASETRLLSQLTHRKQPVQPTFLHTHAWWTPRSVLMLHRRTRAILPTHLCIPNCHLHPSSCISVHTSAHILLNICMSSPNDNDQKMATMTPVCWSSMTGHTPQMRL